MAQTDHIMKNGDGSDELDIETRKQIGQMFLIGFQGSTLSQEIRHLIEHYYIGNIIFARRNITDSVQIANLIHELQQTARAAGHDRPLFIALDQEHGMVSRYGDGERATQFPGAMAIAAARSPSLVFDVAKATAEEMRAVGFNWNLAPVLDVNSDPRNPVIGVRSFGDDPRDVGRFGVTTAEGLNAGGVAVACKHFPGHGATDVDSHLGVPVIRKTRQQLDATELVPFRRAFAANVDAVIVAHIALPDITGEELPSCLSPRIAHDMLRNELGFEGVAVSDCLEMQATLKTVGMERSVPMAAKAGCDVMMICHTYERQKEGIEALLDAVKEGSISREQVAKSAARVEKMKDRYLSWDTALRDPDPTLPPALVQQHADLSRISYEASLTVVRDDKNLLPLSNVIQAADTILLLTPVVKPLNRSIDQSYPVDPFETLGKAIAERHPRVRHAPYTAHGLTPTHETLIRQANAIIIATSNGNRLPYQIAMARHVATVSGNKPLVAIAVCNPYDLASDRTVGTYICTYEYTAKALETAVAVMFGEISAHGILPVAVPGSMVERDQRRWRVEDWNARRDLYPTVDLWQECLGDNWPMDAHTLSFMLDRPQPWAKHFVVRDGKTNTLLGFAATYAIQAGAVEDRYVIGSLACLMVLPSRRNLGIGLSLHDHVMKFLKTGVDPTLRQAQLGSIFPRFFPGLPTNIPRRQQAWFRHRGWKLPPAGQGTCSDVFADLTSFKVPVEVMRPHQEAGVTFRPVEPEEFDKVMEFETANFTKYPGWIEAHQALKDTDHVRDLMVAIDKEGKYLASAIAYSPMENNPIARLLPWPRLIGAHLISKLLTTGDKVGGVTCIGVSQDISMPGLGLGLLCAAIEQLKLRGVTSCFVDWISHKDWYEKAGFKIFREYQESWQTV